MHSMSKEQDQGKLESYTLVKFPWDYQALNESCFEVHSGARSSWVVQELPRLVITGSPNALFPSQSNRSGTF